MRVPIVVFCACAALSGVARIDVVHTAGLPDKRPGLTREKFVGTFDACRLFAEYTREGDRIFRKQWGDYFFGLSLGYSPKNGGWSKWDFLQVCVRTAKGVVNVLAESRPVLFFGYSVEGADFLVGEWACADGKRLRLRFAAYPSHRDWLFLKADFDGLAVESVSLCAYPGNAAVPEGRERHLATKERDWTLNAESADFTPASPFILLYSRYVDEPFGNKVVYDAAPVRSVYAHKTASGVSVRFRPKPAATSMAFALGFFAHEDPNDQRVRFLGEDGDAIHDFLCAVDWAAIPKSDDFRMSVGIAHRLGVPRAALEPVVRRFQAARKACDVVRIAACAEEVRQLRRQAVADGLRAVSSESR